MSPTIRLATPADIARLVALNHEAYPDLVGDGIVFEAAQLAEHQARFAEGQLVAEADGQLVGAIATLVVPGAVALAQHTWSGITANGTFATHDEAGDTLYLADIYVCPRAWGRGVGRALYGALFGLGRVRKLRRAVAGGRLWGYHEVARTMTPEAYVAEVVRGTRRDRVLTSQLRAGFVIRGILHDYLHDWRSAHFATLLSADTLPHRHASDTSVTIMGPCSPTDALHSTEV
jgi:GNAT superfamily N-acetyltransferase